MDFLDHPVQLEVELKQVERRTKDVKSIRFRRPKRFDYLPRQRAFITFGHKNEMKTKPLSFSSSPTEYFLEVTKRMTGHEFSDSLDALKWRYGFNTRMCLAHHNQHL